MKKLTRKVALNFVIQLHKDRSTDRWLVRQHQHTKSDTRSTKYYIVEEHEILHRGVEIEDTRIYPLLKTNQGYIFRRKFQYDCSPKYYEVLYAVSGRSPWQAHFYSYQYSIIILQQKKYAYGLMVSCVVSVHVISWVRFLPQGYFFHYCSLLVHKNNQLPRFDWRSFPF